MQPREIIAHPRAVGGDGKPETEPEARPE
jgi:segregation and condensation protein B